MNFDAVLKVGGSLSRSCGLERLCREISRLAERFHLLIVPGGGKFADQVRDAYVQYDLDETAAHHMALLAMDQFGYLLNRLIAGSVLTSDFLSARRAAESGKAAILLSSALILQADPLPHSWQVTSDTISAWIAHGAGCEQLVLLKDVDGLWTAEKDANSSERLIADLTVEQLAKHNGGVDTYLSHFLASIRGETWVINGLHPERLAELLRTGHTRGTRIQCS